MFGNLVLTVSSFLICVISCCFFYLFKKMGLHSDEIVGTFLVLDRVFTLKVGSYIVGNGSSQHFENNIVLNHPTVDIKHAALVVFPGYIKLIDLFSQHGSYINDNKMQQLEIVELNKASKLKFGDVECLLKFAEKNDWVFPGPENTNIEHSIEKIHVHKNPPNVSAVLTSENANVGDNTLVAATQIPDPSLFHASLLEEDEEYFIPETQEIQKEFSDLTNNSEDMFHLNTQDFNTLDDQSSESENLIENAFYGSLKSIESKSVDKMESVSKEMDESENSDQEIAKALEDIAETELPPVGWLESEQLMKNNKITSNNGTDVDISNQNNIDDCISGNNFQNEVGKKGEMESASIQESILIEFCGAKDNQEPLSVKDNAENVHLMEATQKFQLFNNKSHKTDDDFRMPSIAQFNKVKAGRMLVEEESIESTQHFELPNNLKSGFEKSVANNEYEDLEATQKFSRQPFKQTIPPRSPELLPSDEEEYDTELCLQTTLVVADEKEKYSIINTNSTARTKASSTKSKVQLFQSDEENDVASVRSQSPEVQTPVGVESTLMQPTPDFAFIKLPSVDKIYAANKMYRMKTKCIERKRTLLEESSDEDDPTETMNRLLLEKQSVENNLPKGDLSTSKLSKLDDKNRKEVNYDVNNLLKQTRRPIDSHKSTLKESPTYQEKTSRPKQKAVPSSSNITSKLQSKNDDSSAEILQKRQKSVNFISPSKTADIRAGRLRKKQMDPCEHLPVKRSKENDATMVPTTIDEKSGISRKSSRALKPRIIFTKIDSKPHANLMEKIGAKKVENLVDCTALMTDSLYRTCKLLCAMGRGTPIISLRWLHEAAKCKEAKHQYPNYDDYLIKDIGTEKQFKFKLKESLERARKSPVFKGYSFFCTPNTKPPPKELYCIIECAGGSAIRRIPKGFKQPNDFFIVSDKADVNLWPNLRSLVEDVFIIKTEGILIAVMQQRIAFRSYLLQT